MNSVESTMIAIEQLLEWDAALRAWLTAYHHPVLDVLMVGVTIAGRGAAVWFGISAVLVLIDRHRLRAVVSVLVAVLLAHVLTDHALKPLVTRARPFESAAGVRVLDRPSDPFSFPSGHAATAAAAAMTLARVWPTGRWLLWPLAALVALSRVYVGVHYPLDVIGGALLGLACGWVGWRVTAPLRARR